MPLLTHFAQRAILSPMKIEGTGRTSQSSSTGKKDKASGDVGAFRSLMAGGAEETHGAAAAGSIAQIDVLLALQGADDPAQRAARGRMKQRGDTLLNELDKMRLGLLSGTLTVGQVVDIADVVASHREKILDPQLTAILDEIDLRAQIELAKVRKALEKNAR